MKAVLQRVQHASVAVDTKNISQIETGLLILLGIEHSDTQKDADYLLSKILNLRIFDDKNKKINHSILQIKGELLIVSQFTLLADCRRGNRPSFDLAAGHEKALKLYHYFVNRISEVSKLTVKTGEFAADMKVTLTNDGPVTIILESQNKI